MGFKKKTPKEVTQIIESDIAERRLMEKMTLVKDNKEKEKEEEEYDNKKKKEDKNRKFLDYCRPPNCWNFFEDSEEKTPHVLRPEAKP
jgi:hypothetical protein